MQICNQQDLLGDEWSAGYILSSVLDLVLSGFVNDDFTNSTLRLGRFSVVHAAGLSGNCVQDSLLELIGLVFTLRNVHIGCALASS